METVKKFLKNILSVAWSLLAIVIVCLMVMVMITWTIGAVYMLTEAGCVLEAGKLVCG